MTTLPPPDPAPLDGAALEAEHLELVALVADELGVRDLGL